jgi:IclR family acetate operon transcriptional repressor
VRNPEGYELLGVHNALRALEFIQNHNRVTVSSLSTELGVSRAAAHRLLRTLEAEGFASLALNNRGYFSGPRLLSKAPQALEGAHRSEIRTLLSEACDTLGESAHSAILIGDQVLVVDGKRLASKKGIGLRSGMTVPAHTMAAGKLLLAGLDDSQVMGLFREEKLSARGPGSITSRSRLLQELAVIRKRGWAQARNESEPNVHSVAVPLDGQVLRDRMALVVSVPASRAGGDSLVKLALRSIDIVNDYATQGKVSPWSL